jgi:cob(I)alamin adenosyltransferase
MATREARRGRVIVNTGHGKGKTTAALGVMTRAWGRDWKVCVLQWIKATTSNYGEHRAARKMGIDLISMGAGFTWLSKDVEKDVDLAQQCWDEAKRRILSGDYDLVILDEITYPINYGWLDFDDILDTLRQRPHYVHVICTGRDADQRLIEYADLVTDMQEVKHPFKQGIRAQAGIEF